MDANWGTVSEVMLAPGLKNATPENTVGVSSDLGSLVAGRESAGVELNLGGGTEASIKVESGTQVRVLPVAPSGDRKQADETEV